MRGRTILAIALEAGFSDQSWFNRAFRRHYGASPTDVREAACTPDRLLALREGRRAAPAHP